MQMFKVKKCLKISLIMLDSVITVNKNTIHKHFWKRIRKINKKE